jgi:DNA helicase II / ATP-dependent DNA helicase PcrA
MSILEALNPAQCEAAEIVDGPLLILAGAGSGKTRVLTYRIAYLINELGVNPWNILAVTFTNKAAGEMRERVEKLVGGMAGQIWGGTFHSICARLLRFEAEPFGLDSNFTIYDEDDRRAAMRRVMEAHDIDDQDLKPRAVIAQISRAKNSMLDPHQFALEAGESPHRQQIAELFTSYEAELRRNNAFDFDDLLVEVVRQFDNHPEVLAKYQERFRFLLVDEYQDTNRPQYLFCRQLAAAHRNICVVGDDDQSIYQFRGADIRNILDFERDYPEAKVVRLEQNYRSTGRILAAANAIIQNNQHRKGKELWTQAGDGELIELVECDTDRREARYIVDKLRRFINYEGYSPGDTAILYRTNAQSRALEEELQRSGMPYIIVGSIRFYERKEIKDILAYLRLLANPADAINLLRIINVPRRGIGDTSLERLQVFAREQSLGLYAALDHLDQVPRLGGRAVKSLTEFRDLAHGLVADRGGMDLPELGQAIFERSGYRQMLLDENSPEAEVRAENVDQLIAFMTEFSQTREAPTLESFLEEIALMSPLDESPDTSKMITLMTLHSAKGLEFPLVFLSGMEENLFPTSRAVEESRTNPQAIEEERRLCYVGITRARERLFMTYACRRYTFGSMIDTSPSRFLDELPSELVALKREVDFSARAPRPGAARGGSGNQIFAAPEKPKRKPEPKGVHYEWDEPPASQDADDLPTYVDASDPFAVGQWVKHPSWGRGEIVAREGQGEKMKLSIRFKGSQVKKVAVAYARLEPA